MTGGDWFQLFVIVLLIAAVGVLGASEVSITRVNRVRAYRFVEEKRRGASSLSKVAENPAPYLNVVLLLTLLATIGGTTIATSLAVRLFHGAGEIVATVAMTLLLFVFAEVTPKTFAIQQTDRVALVLAPLIVSLGRLVGPLATGLVIGLIGTAVGAHQVGVEDAQDEGGERECGQAEWAWVGDRGRHELHARVARRRVTEIQRIHVRSHRDRRKAIPRRGRHGARDRASRGRAG